ncbi:MAG: carbamoyltransferase [Nitrospinota bacterium]
MPTHILGISCFYHDAAACLLRDGEIVAAASEERFTRKKHDADFPRNAIQYCLEEGGIGVDDLDYVGFYDKPFTKFERILTTYLGVAPRGIKSWVMAIPLWMKEKIFLRKTIQKRLGYEGDILFSEHHESHAASSFYCSPFDEAAILTLDGVGEWATAAKGVGRGEEITLTHEIHFPHSLGLLYTAFTYYLGFKVNSGEYKVMGLAPYGEPAYYDRIMDNLIDVKPDGSFRLNMDYFAYTYDLKMINRKFEALFGGPPRVPETWLNQREFDIAASIQRVTEEVVLRLCRSLHEETGLDNLCLAGGVALNCVANGRVLRETPFTDIYVQPAAGDAGGAVGVAQLIWHRYLGRERRRPLRDAYLGPAYSDDEIRAYLDEKGVPYRELGPDELVSEVARLIEEKNVIGWFQGRMEFGPRALGSRSILADARDPEMRNTVNMRIKFREGFRPFAPSVTMEGCAEWFELECPSPYMLLVANVREGKRVIPSVTHVDHSARIQTVTEEENPLYHRLLKAYERRTGVPVFINTSFNVRGEPIVRSPADAYLCFMRTDMDYLAMGGVLLDKKAQPPLREDVDWRSRFELD